MQFSSLRGLFEGNCHPAESHSFVNDSVAAIRQRVQPNSSNLLAVYGQNAGRGAQACGCSVQAFERHCGWFPIAERRLNCIWDDHATTSRMSSAICSALVQCTGAISCQLNRGQSKRSPSQMQLQSPRRCGAIASMFELLPSTALSPTPERPPKAALQRPEPTRSRQSNHSLCRWSSALIGANSTSAWIIEETEEV